ncbi:hypothetical protein PMAYCL1PPCAC_24889, partial [Pristionchus mayeri]
RLSSSNSWMSPLAKIRKTDSRGMEKEPPAGIIRFEVDNVSRLCADRSSHEIEVKGVPWKASVCRTNLSTHSGTIDGSLFCTIDQSKDWKIDLDAEFILVHSDSTKNTTVEMWSELSNEHEIFNFAGAK